MTIKKRLRIICLGFSIMPLMIVYWLGKNAGLAGNNAFEHAVALALMSSILLGLFSSGAVKYWFLGKQLEKIKEFCLAVKDGSYHVFLPVPNESSDIDDENEMVELMRTMNWMAHHIKLNEESLQSQKEELEQAYTKQLIVQKKLENRTKQLTEVLHKVRNLLDHAGQGFVSFGQELKVAPEYSAECITIFQKEIAEESIAKLLYPLDEKQEEFVTNVLEKIFTVEDNFLRETYFTLLPSEIAIDCTYIKIDYKFIHKESHKEIMLILTDVTEVRKMEEQIQEEKDILSMVVKVVTQYEDFSDAVAGYTAFCEDELPGIVQADCLISEKLSTIFRIIHTWKGTFAQLNMQNIVKELHNVEGELAALREEEVIPAAAFIELISAYSSERMVSWLTDDTNILKRILGDGFLRQHTMVNIEKAKLHQLKEKIRHWPGSSQKQEIALGLEMLTYRPFQDLLRAYPEYTVSLAKRYEKGVHPFVITGEQVFVNPETYHDAAQTFVHLFRNAVAHGLETMEERLDAGKEESGRISCKVQLAENDILVMIKDDGCGIDTERLKKVAVERKILDRRAALSLSDDEAMQLIFADGFSSASCADDISGRGVGLYAVRSEVEKLGGKIEVHSEMGVGTEFRLIVPLLHSI
ncbi:ATP-binding protein [Pelosinus propionicus]|uniref:histidine kinase n=1 Tax=Pelosinus propionicus DSM 13327 TaxID=1123291 RepID=A0A1I4N5C0_9FIRM|nr:ATP-binding protein [Pelosinus propionicus]SFM10699.1 two-component system, chemotaxis family, sensor kinase CheA [Pelosinus propionicus DSM 13327]